jgi:uncharacterized protein YijF (DUF1287 family)
MILPFRHGVRIFVLVAFSSLYGLVQGQLNPSVDTVTAKRAALSNAALNEVGMTTIYDPSYVKLDYPGGDVPLERGVCTDVVIRALRHVDVDLQVLVHEDKKKSPAAYPHDWDGSPLDANIDHRRVPNLMVFFKREGKELPVSKSEADYLPGDIVVWRLPSGLLHMGLVTDRTIGDMKRPLMVHNIGEGAQCEDVLFAFPIVGHYRWFL